MSQSATIQFQKRRTTEFIAVLDIEQTDARDLDVAHRRLGYLCIGVHYVVLTNGAIQYGRDRDAVGAKLTKSHDTTVYVAVAGPKSTQIQEDAVCNLLAQLQATYPLAIVLDTEGRPSATHLHLPDQG